MYERVDVLIAGIWYSGDLLRETAHGYIVKLDTTEVRGPTACSKRQVWRWTQTRALAK